MLFLFETGGGLNDASKMTTGFRSGMATGFNEQHPAQQSIQDEGQSQMDEADESALVHNMRNKRSAAQKKRTK